jgi:MFS family permease
MLIENSAYLSSRGISLASFAISSIVLLHAGTLYGFSAYEQELSSALDSTHVAIIGSIGDAGLFLGVLTGLFYAHLGKAWTAVYSLLLLSGGYFGCYLSLVYFPSVPAFCVFYFMIGQGSQGLMFICLTVNSINFPIRHRGLIMGLLLAFFALAAIVWTLIYQYPLDYNIKNFYLTLAIATGVASLLTLFFIGNASRDGEVSIVQRHKEHADNDIETSSVPVVAESKNCCCLGPEVLPNEDHFEVQDISGLALLKITEFWLLWGTEFIVVGVSLMWKNHVGMFGFPESYTGRLVMVWVAVNAGARFVTGAASDWLRAVFARTGFFLIGACILAASHMILFAAPTVGTVWLADICTGLAYGMCICGLNQILSIFFGLNKFGFNHGMLNTAGALGAVFFTVICSVIVNARDLKSAACTGDGRLECYRYPFLFSTFFLLFAIFLSCLLMTRYPPSFLMYRSVSQSDSKEDALREEVFKNESEGLPPFVSTQAD